ncbi:GNAT family N-acetyltransferase [Adlercreutzia sp. R7]|uniref:GNAT family N-acetyltransferase n=1 Tax=Adlercreutzia wanghongyangiae TaxID=3111451 RepID=A0ABU6IEY8_9ACTN|nr:GNAT family N-acetyltransferase [Adlercreutzia sp. R7]
MVILIGGASHTGKTLLAQRLMERYRYPVLSIDLLKMGLIRSGQTALTPEDDDLLIPYLWGIVREIIKTAVENRQNLIVEGCYIPFDWEDDFDSSYLEQIEYVCLIMSRRYLEDHGDDVICYENVIERRLIDEVDISGLIEENGQNLASCQQHGLRYHLIDGDYDVGEPEVAPLSGSDLDAAAKLFRNTVHAVNSRDYAPEQLDAWVPRDKRRLTQIAEKLSGQQTVGLKECGILVGFGSLDDKGDIDMLFVHKDRQKQGIAKVILRELERLALERGKQVVSTFASVTARPFFERMGYAVERENVVNRDGVSLVNYLMSKQLP